MTRFNLAVICCLAWAISARAALPPSAIDEQTAIVATMNVSRLDAAETHASLRQLVTAADSQAGTKIELVLGIFQIEADSLQASGLQSMTLVWSLPAAEGESPYYALYLQMKPGSRPDEIKKTITAAWPDKDISPAFDPVGGFLVAHPHDHPLHTSGSAAQAKIFGEAIGAMGDRALSVAFAPTPRVKKLMPLIPSAGLSEKGETILPLVLSSKWSVIGLRLGKTPDLSMLVQGTDEAQATKLMDAIKAPVDTPSSGDKSSSGGGGEIDWLKVLTTAGHPVRSGSRVAMTLPGPALGQLLAYAIQKSPAPGVNGQPKQGK